MRKALIPMLASLVLCGAATGALIATNASAEGTHKPKMALVGSSALLAQNIPAQSTDMRATEDSAPMKDFCDDRYALEVGHMAYLETRLELNETQRPLFDRWKQVLLEAASRRAADCNQRVTLDDRESADPVARMSREEDTLKKRLSDLEAERPVFASFYQSLKPEQRQLLSPPTLPSHDRGLVVIRHDRPFARPATPPASQ